MHVRVVVEGTNNDGEEISETLPAFTVNTPGTVSGATFGLTLGGTSTGSSLASILGTTSGTMTKVGTDGVVTVEESSTMNTELEVTEGIGFDKGFISAYFVTDFDSQEAVLEDALVLLHRDKISSLPDLLPLLGVESARRG